MTILTSISAGLPHYPGIRYCDTHTTLHLTGALAPLWRLPPIKKKGLAQPFMRVLMALAEGFMAVPYVNSQAATAAAARRPAP
ncbi:hypothetical protein J6590_055430 [Homalodisca vitripennis]|nr:hypothetical protein J6590_055430 [Homalodisca vitripennis]